MNVSCRRVLSLPPALPPCSSRSASWEPGSNRVRFHDAATPNAPDSHFPNGMNRPQPQKELREDVSRRYGLRTQGAGREDEREFHAFRVALAQSPVRKTGSTGQGSGQRLIEHLLCFHGKLGERKFCGKEKFFHLFLIDFPLQAKESCVSLKTSKRRGTFQGITERGT